MRLLVGGVLALAVVVYVLAVISGAIPTAQRLGVTDLAVIVVGAAGVSFLVWPELLEHVQRVRLGSVEFQLQSIRRDQETQGKELANLRLALMLALTEEERKHLLNLARPGRVDYTGNESVRTELRRLRALGLISSKGYIGELVRDNGRFDLQQVAELTKRGSDYLAGITEADAATHG